MIELDVTQGSDEWHAARLGIPTASNFGKILTPTGKASTQAEAYRMKLLAEWLTKERESEPTNYWMDRGRMLQPQAIEFYSQREGVSVREIGLCYLDERKLVAASPDGLVGVNGGLEVKCPSGGVHLRFLLDGAVPSEHIPQVQGNLWVTGRKWWDYESYHPQMPSDVIRVERDEAYIEQLACAVDSFLAKMLFERATLLVKGFRPSVEQTLNLTWDPL